MLTFSYDCTTFCSYLLGRDSFIKTFFLLLFPLWSGWFCWKRTITAVSCCVFQSDVLRCLSFALPVGAHLNSNGSLCLLTWAGVPTNIWLWPSFFFLSFHLSTSDKIPQNVCVFIVLFSFKEWVKTSVEFSGITATGLTKGDDWNHIVNIRVFPKDAWPQIPTRNSTDSTPRPDPTGRGQSVRVRVWPISMPSPGHCVPLSGKLPNTDSMHALSA